MHHVTVVMVHPTSWSALGDALFADAWNRSLGRFRMPYAFRGQATVSEDLSSGLVRLAAGRRNVEQLELHLLRNFRKYAYGQSGADSIWHWLALGQHRGLPTRLLDWTYSPFVALHFATSDLASMDHDGVVWAINFVKANRSLPRRLGRILRAEGSDTATVDMLSRFGSLRAFDRLSRRPFVVFLEPPSLDPRIVNQFALFSLMSSPRATLDTWLARHAVARRVLIPAALKWEIRDKLDQLNINERVLFPGLDGLSRWLTRYYWPKPAQEALPPRTLRKSPRARRGSE
ncbi:MAG TPA: FRG domain-containing protein [Vicinamibacterales bacterium]